MKLINYRIKKCHTMTLKMKESSCRAIYVWITLINLLIDALHTGCYIKDEIIEYIIIYMYNLENPL